MPRKAMRMARMSSPDRAVSETLVAKDGAGSGIHDEPDVAFDAPDFDISLICRKDGGLWIFIVVNKGFNDNGGRSGIVGDLLMWRS